MSRITPAATWLYDRVSQQSTLLWGIGGLVAASITSVAGPNPDSTATLLGLSWFFPGLYLSVWLVSNRSRDRLRFAWTQLWQLLRAGEKSFSTLWMFARHRLRVLLSQSRNELLFQISVLVYSIILIGFLNSTLALAIFNLLFLLPLGLRGIQDWFARPQTIGASHEGDGDFISAAQELFRMPDQLLSPQGRTSLEVSGRASEIRELQLEIVLPFRNAEKTLQASISSVFLQNSEKWNLTLIDDGSSDESLRIAHSAKNQLPQKVKVLSSYGRGPGAARNLGISHTSSSHIGFLDADDLLLPTYVWEILEGFGRGNHKAVIFSWLAADPALRELREPETVFRHIKPDLVEELLSFKSITHPFTVTAPMIWNKAFSADTILRSKILFPEDPVMIEDMPTVYPWLIAADSCLTLQKTLYVHTSQSGSLSADHMTNFESMARSLGELKARVSSHISVSQQDDFEAHVLLQLLHGLDCGSREFARGMIEHMDSLEDGLGLSRGVQQKKTLLARARKLAGA